MSRYAQKDGYLYVTATESNAIKFGITKDPNRRLKEHRTSMGHVSPIIFEWISDKTEAYRDVEASMVKIYGSEYISGFDPQKIVDEIQALIDSWVKIEEPKKVKSRASFHQPYPILQYKDLVTDITPQRVNYESLIMSNGYMEYGNNVLASQAILFMFGFIDRSDNEILEEASYLHSTLSKLSTSDIVEFAQAISRRKSKAKITEAASTAGVKLGRIEGLMSL